MSDEWTTLFDQWASSDSDGPPPLEPVDQPASQEDSSDSSDDTQWDFEISVKIKGKKVQAVNVSGGRRGKKKSKPKTDMPPKDEKGLSKNLQNRNLIEGGNSSSSDRRFTCQFCPEENQKSEKNTWQDGSRQAWWRMPLEGINPPPRVPSKHCIICGCDFQDTYECCGKADRGKSAFETVIQGVEDLFSTRKKHKQFNGWGPIMSIIRANEDEKLLKTSRRLENLVKPAHKHGVRQCPWDQTFTLIPLLDLATGEIAGYGKKDSHFGLGSYYCKEGEKEWIKFDELGNFIGRKRARELMAENHFETRKRMTDGHIEVFCEITECMVALFLFPRPPLPPKRYGNCQRDMRPTVCVDALRDYIEQIGCSLMIDVYRRK